MKMFIALMMLVSATAFAQGSTPLQAGDLSLSAAEAKIVSVNELCPSVPGRVRCMAYGSVVNVKVSLSGCLNRLGGTFSKFEVVDGKGVLYFGAINIFNKASMTARCVRMPSEIVSVNVPFEGEIELAPMDFASKL